MWSVFGVELRKPLDSGTASIEMVESIGHVEELEFSVLELFDT